VDADINYTWQRLYGIRTSTSRRRPAPTTRRRPSGLVRRHDQPIRSATVVLQNARTFSSVRRIRGHPESECRRVLSIQSGAPWNALGRDVPYRVSRRYLNSVRHVQRRPGTMSTFSRRMDSASPMAFASRSRTRAERAEQSNGTHSRSSPIFHPAVETATAPYFIAPKERRSRTRHSAPDLLRRSATLHRLGASRLLGFLKRQFKNARRYPWRRALLFSSRR